MSSPRQGSFNRAACVIGAGPAGLAAAAALSARGVDCEVLEHHTRPGGIWATGRRPSPIWSGTRLISPAAIAGFPDAPMPGRGYPTAAEVGEYLDAFASDHRLHGLIRFSRTVRAVTRSGSGWQVDTGDVRRHYETVVLATGQHWVPRVPIGIAGFAGQVLHSSAYLGSAPFNDQRVLIVGGGNSAGDLASDLASSAAAVTLSVRRGFYIIPRWIDGQPTAEWVQGPTGSADRLSALVRERQRQLHAYGMPWPEGTLLESNPVVNDRLAELITARRVLLRPPLAGCAGRTVQFRDGTEEAFDTVIFATGYRPGPLVRALAQPTRDRLDLVGGMISPSWDGLLVLGLFEADGPTFPVLALQAELAARIVALRHDGADASDLEATIAPAAAAIDARAGRRYSGSPRNYAAVSFHAYTQQLLAMTAALDVHSRTAQQEGAPAPRR